MQLLPEPKQKKEGNGSTPIFQGFAFTGEEAELEEMLELARLRFWDQKEIGLRLGEAEEKELKLRLIPSLEGYACEKQELFLEQGYVLEIKDTGVILRYEDRQGFLYGVTSLKRLLEKKEEGYRLPLGEILDYPSIPVRAVAPTFSWYAGYGRIGFDMQLWGFEEWVEFINICVDHKINQMNMVMYGYWPFAFEEYPETVFQDIPVKIWNKENRRFLTVKYSHPNVAEPYLEKLIAYAHRLGMKIFAYVGLNSYNGAYSIKHPEKRMKPPAGSKFLNDFDSLCLSDEENVSYIIASMVKIAKLGFDGYTLEESEEGFWFCECEACRERWHRIADTPGEAKHKANMWLLNKIYQAAREVNPDLVFGIRAFRQPPLEKEPEFLRQCAESMPKDMNLFWAPALYVPPTEFEKWIEAFGKERIWGRDSEANSITSTMGRLYRVFASNMIRYEDEANVQVIERDIEQHISSVEAGVHGINGFMFEWFGLFMHLWAHGNYGWGSKMDQEEFFSLACRLQFGQALGEKVLYVLKHMVTIHESQIPLYTTPFPFQKNKMEDRDIPAILEAKKEHPHLLGLIKEIQEEVAQRKELRHFIPHFARLENAQLRNRVIYDMVLTALDYEREQDPEKKDALLDKILEYNEADFELVKDMFFDICPVSETGVKSCMIPYHELKREIHNIRRPEDPQEDMICSGIEALGWLWL